MFHLIDSLAVYMEKLTHPELNIKNLQAWFFLTDSSLQKAPPITTMSSSHFHDFNFACLITIKQLLILKKASVIGQKSQKHSWMFMITNL